MSRKNNSVEEVCGVKWYHYLVPDPNTTCLLDQLESPEEKFIVCATLPTENPKKPMRLFAGFNSLLEFVNHIKRIPKNRWYFFEVILGNRPQKLYFDIDVKVEELDGDIDLFMQALLDSLIGRIIDAFWRYGHQLDLSKNILLFSSNSDKKRSYHLIVDGFAVSTNVENRALAEEILDGFPQGYLDYIDPAVYSTKQQFRLYLSQKPHSGRPKVFVEKWNYGPREIISELSSADPSLSTEMQEAVKLTQIFMGSAITYTNNCKLIPILFVAPQEGIPRVKTEYDEDLEITEDHVKEIVTKADPNLFQIYKPDKIVGGLILLKRKRPAHCSLCNRIHENENAFLRVSEKGKVYFYCRRNANQNKYVTQITLPENTELFDQHARSAIQQYISMSQAQRPLSPIQQPLIETQHSKLRLIAAKKQ